MVDDSTDVGVTSHVLVFATFVEEWLPITAFAGLLEIHGGRIDAQIIYDCLPKTIG